MVDTEGSGNMMYLPLDKIMERQNATNNSTGTMRQLEGLRNQGADIQNQLPENNSSTRGVSRSGRN
jgi:membrane protease subunit HflK